jgi:hypothetical protein
LYYPASYQPGRRYPAVLIGGSWTNVKEQMSATYAEKLSERGYLVLTLDFRGFGESEGEPRQYESPDRKVEDFKSALSWLESLPEADADRLAVVGVCASGGYLSRVASGDKRVKALATVAAWIHDGEAVKLIYSGQEGVQQRLQAAREAKQRYQQSGQATLVPLASDSDPQAAMFGPFDYYLNPGRGALPAWNKGFNVMSWEDWLTYDPTTIAKGIQVPTLMIHSDEAVLPDYAKRFFNEIPHPHKELYWTEGNQFDFYDNERNVNESVEQVDRFFRQHLA